RRLGDEREEEHGGTAGVRGGAAAGAGADGRELQAVERSDQAGDDRDPPLALAASTLDSASSSLATVVAKNPEDKEQIKKMVDQLDELFKRFKDAEDA